MDPVSIVTGGIAFATSLKDIILLGLKLRESLQNMKQDMNEFRMLSHELLTDMYRLQAYYDRVSYIDSSQSEHLLYELDSVKLCLERILKTCQKLAQGKSAGLFPLWAEWNLRCILVNELPRLRRQVESIRSQFMFHSTIRIEHALLVQSTERSALLHRSQGAVAALLSDPDSDYAHSIVVEMDHDVEMGVYTSIAVQYLKLQITSLWTMAEHPLSNASSISAQPRWDPNSSEPRYLDYCSSASVMSLSKQVLSLFVELSSWFYSDSGKLLDALTNIARHIAFLGMHHAFPQLMCRMEQTAKQIASNQQGFAVNHAYFIYRMANYFSAVDNTESANTWCEKGLQVVDDAKATGVWSGENTSHLSAALHLLHGQNCLLSSQWIALAEPHLTEVLNITRQLLDLSSSDFPVPPIIHHNWLRGTGSLIDYHQRVGQSQQALSHMLECLGYYLHIDLKDIDYTSALIASDLSCRIQKVLTTFKGYGMPLTAIRKILSLAKQLSRIHHHLYVDLFIRLVVYECIATYFLAQGTKALSTQQLCLMQSFVGARLGDADSRCLDTQLRHALSFSFELQGEDYVYNIFLAYLFSSYTSGLSIDMAAQSFIRDIITQLTIRFPMLTQKAIAESATWYHNAPIIMSPSHMKSIAITLLDNIQSLPFEPNTPIATSDIHTLLSLLPKSRRSLYFHFLINFGDIEGARALLMDVKSEEGPAYKFICSIIELQPDSLTLAVTDLDDLSTHTIESLASRHQMRDAFTALKLSSSDIDEDLIDLCFPIIMYSEQRCR